MFCKASCGKSEERWQINTTHYETIRGSNREWTWRGFLIIAIWYASSTPTLLIRFWTVFYYSAILRNAMCRISNRFYSTIRSRVGPVWRLNWAIHLSRISRHSLPPTRIFSTACTSSMRTLYVLKSSIHSWGDRELKDFDSPGSTKHTTTLRSLFAHRVAN